MTGVAGLVAGSLRATELAMHDAGIRGDEVQFVGFSQGGLVATRLAASGTGTPPASRRYGAPAGRVALPAGIAGMAIRNTDDFIPALGGPQSTSHLLQVERRAFAPGSPIPDEQPARASAPYLPRDRQAIDRASSSAVREQIAALDDFPPTTPSRGLDGHRGCTTPRGPLPAAGRPRERTQDDADQPRDDAEHDSTEHAPPEVLDDEAESDQAADPGDEQTAAR